MTALNDLPLYRQVADRLAAAVHDGAYRQGDRLPSVRMLARDWDVSINTVIEAYRDLSAHGLITARPQTGYFVSAADSTIVEPGESTPPAGPTPIGTSELALQVLQDGRRPGMLALGAALPDPAKLPLTEVDRIINRILADDPEIAHRYEMPPGAASLRTAIARLYLHADCRLHSDGIVATAGGLEAMVLALRATCPPGAIVAVESPTYYGILQALDGLGLQALEIPTSPQGGMNLGVLCFALDEHRVAAVMVISNFCNPGGSRMSDQAKQELVVLLAERDLPLIEETSTVTSRTMVYARAWRNPLMSLAMPGACCCVVLSARSYRRVYESVSSRLGVGIARSNDSRRHRAWLLAAWLSTPSHA